MQADKNDRRLIWVLIGLCLSSFAFGVTATLWLAGPPSVAAQVVPPMPPQSSGRRAGETSSAAAAAQPAPIGGARSGVTAEPGAGAASRSVAAPKAGAPPATVLPAPPSPAPPSPAPLSPATIPASAPPAGSNGRSAGAADDFRLQFGAFLDAGTAQAVATMLKERGFQPTIVAQKDFAGRDWQLVQVGRFSDAGSANLASSELAGLAGLSPVIIDAGTAPARP